ncbi:MAG TPA: VWA domain-containing protein [Candidatus Acidoferrum sp.]|jgi:hypothetical protein
MRNYSLIIAAFFALLLSAQLTWAEDVPCIHRTLSLNVIDSSGVPVNGVTTDDLQATFRSRPLKILSIVPDDRPHRIVILLDASGSMAAQRGRVLASATALANAPLKNSRIALIIFGSKIIEQLDFSQGQAAVVERLRQIGTGESPSKELFKGKTTLYDSMLAALRLIENPTSADAVYLASNGLNDRSRAHLDTVETEFLSTGVRLFEWLFITEIANRDLDPEQSFAVGSVSALGKTTGGATTMISALNFQNREELLTAVDLLHQEIIHNYRIEIDLPESLKRPQGWKLRPSEKNKDSWKKFRITHPTELASCGPKI